MKNNKKIWGIIIGITIIIITVLIVFIVNTIRSKQIQENGYLTKGEYYKFFVEEYNMTSNDYTVEERKNAADSKDYSVFASIMIEWEFITEKQAKDLNKPLTKEIVAQTIVRSMIDHNSYNMEIKDIKKCYDRQSIIDAVGMGIFELKNGNFDPYSYMTLEEVKNAIEKSREIISTPSGEEAKVDWSELKINIDGIDYNYPYKLSQFLENGWQVSSGSQELMNQTVAKASKYEMSEEEKQWYIENGYEVPENLTMSVSYEIYKGNSTISFIVDSAQSDALVKDANVIRTFIKNTNFNFYGIEKDFTIEQVKNLFGTKNYSIVTTDKDVHTEYHNSISYGATGYGVIFVLDDDAKLVKDIIITTE